MSTGNAFLGTVADELTHELIKRLPPPSAGIPMDPDVLYATWRPIAQTFLAGLIKVCFHAVEEKGLPVPAKVTWEASAERANLPQVTGLSKEDAVKAEAAAWDVLGKTPALQVAAVFKMPPEKIYMLQRTGGAIIAQPFPAP